MCLLPAIQEAMAIGPVRNFVSRPDLKLSFLIVFLFNIFDIQDASPSSGGG